MAGDFRSKHRRSSDDDDEAAKSTKRHKHRHHHRHHRHSSKRDEESEIEDGEVAPPAIHHPPDVLNGLNLKPDDDVEEGEILDEEGFGGYDKELETCDGSSEHILGDRVEDPLTGGELVHNSSPLVEEKGKRKHNNLKTVKEDWNGNDVTNSLTPEKEDKTGCRDNFATKMNGESTLRRHLSAKPKNELVSGGNPHDLGSGDMGYKPCKVDNSDRMESDFSLRGIDRGKRYYHADHVEGDESRMAGKRNSLSPNRLGTKHKPPPSRYRYEDEVQAAARSRSIEHGRERSHSHSVIEEDVRLKRSHHVDRDSTYHTLKDKTEYDSDEGRISSSSKDRLPIGGENGLRSRDRWEKDRRRESESDRDGKRDADRDGDWGNEERQRSKDRDHRRERELLRSRDRDRGRERERESSRDRDRGRERERESSRDRDQGRERERERSMDKRNYGGGRERERSRDRERKRDAERHGSKDREVDRDRRRDWKDKDAERESNRDVDRDRDRVRVKDMIWESGRNGQTDRVKDVEKDKDKYRYLRDDYVDRDRHRQSRLSRHDELEYQRDRNRKYDSAKIHSSKSDSLEEGEEKQKRDKDEQEDYDETVPLQLAEQEEEDLNRIKEESRRRRQAILEKYKSKQSEQKPQPQSEDAEKEKVSTEKNYSQSIDPGNEIPDNHDDSSNGVDTSGAEPTFSVGKSPSQNGIFTFERNTSTGGLGEGTPKSERSNDMFCDDIFGESPDDIFAESPAGARKLGKEDCLHIERSGFHDNWDDADGYYSYRFGEILDGRYEVIAAHGKGVFSTVVRAKDLKASNDEPEEVAIKIIRNNDTMYKAGIEELGILKKLVGADPDDRRRCVRFLSSFKYRNHLCLVFESLNMNLREVLKKFGRNIGLKLTAVKAYAKQLFVALKHLKNCGVLHCDIKPDNMLVNEAKNVLKLCDFGNAMYAGKNEITPYLVSRFYRAPEIILGLPYDHPLDIWSVGCCLYELYTGKVLFPGHTNNDMLRLHMELKGPFPKKMLRKGGFIDQHFDQDLNFLATEDDPVTKKVIRRTIFSIKPKDIGSIISGSSGEDPKMLANFKDLLEKIFMLDPEKRITVLQALNHPFITGK